MKDPRDLSKSPTEDPNPVLRIARDGTLLHVNKAGLTLIPQWGLGVRRASLPVLREAVLRALGSGATQEVDLEHGGRVYSFVVAPNGTARYANLYGRDITERKRAELTSKESEARYRKLIEQSLDAVIIMDDRGRIQVVNERACRMLGYPREDLAQINIADTYLPEERATLVERIARAQRGEHLRYQRTFVRKDGTTFPADVTIVMLPNGLIQGITRDITERKRAEEALAESAARLRGLFNNMVEGVAYCWMMCEDGRPVDFVYLEVNAAFETLTGLKNVAGRRASAVIPGIRETDPQVFEILGRVASTGQHERFEIFVVGMAAWFSVTAYSPAKDHFIAVFDVITERKLAERRAQQFSQEIIAAREAERKHVSSALHNDLGSMAVGIAAHLDAIEQDLRSGRPAEALEWTRRTRSLFDETVARLKEVAVQLRPPELDILGLGAALRQHFDRATKVGGPVIHFREDLGRRRVSGATATVLFRVAQEALTNAIRHGRARRVDVSLLASKKEIRLTVRDDGMGFNLSAIKKAATSRMGLRVMEEMAAASRGGFKIHSEQRKGTTVCVSLPYGTTAMQAEGVTVQTGTAARLDTTRSDGPG